APHSEARKTEILATPSRPGKRYFEDLMTSTSSVMLGTHYSSVLVPPPPNKAWQQANMPPSQLTAALLVYSSNSIAPSPLGR
ncbi:hypothetical protein, partial [Trinickia mobilis]|uniref:hypothetical protein n=1 Tax=Trinickia mobilis TaxID=2816356 RepID=UPI001A8EDB63